MKIELIVSCYNEEFLLPFFLKHYWSFADRIVFLFGFDSTDKSKEIIEKAMADSKANGGPEIVLVDGTEMGGINDRTRIDRINFYYKISQADWCVLLDVDEFLLLDREYLENIPLPYNYLSAKVLQVHPHVNDKPLDINIPVQKQRRHGYWYNTGRPVILRTKQKLDMEIGKHSIFGTCHQYPEQPIMLHWQMADRAMALNRRLNNRKNRFSQTNLTHNWGWHEVQSTEEILNKEFDDHAHDLIII